MEKKYLQKHRYGIDLVRLTKSDDSSHVTESMSVHSFSCI